jgi:hypothetical protein
MKRSVFASALTLLFCSVTVSLAVAQATPAVSQAKTAAPAAPAPAAKAGFVMPLKGEGTVLVLQGTSKFDPKLKEVTTTYKIKNTSSAPIAMLKMDEYWYENKKMVSTDTQRYKQPFQPGEVEGSVIGGFDVQRFVMFFASPLVDVPRMRALVDSATLFLSSSESLRAWCAAMPDVLRTS